MITKVRPAAGLVALLLAVIGSGNGTAGPVAPQHLVLADPVAVPAAPIRLAEMDLDEQVAEVQRMLRRHGLNPGPVDGKLGLRTRDAIRTYQDLAKNAPVPGPAAALARAKGPPPAQVSPARGD